MRQKFTPQKIFKKDLKFLDHAMCQKKIFTRTEGKVNIDMETTKIRVIEGLLTMILKLFMNLVNVLDRNWINFRTFLT